MFSYRQSGFPQDDLVCAHHYQIANHIAKIFGLSLKDIEKLCTKLSEMEEGSSLTNEDIGVTIYRYKVVG